MFINGLRHHVNLTAFLFPLFLQPSKTQAGGCEQAVHSCAKWNRIRKLISRINGEKRGEKGKMVASQRD
ncbi:hypothetical protein [Cytobacillus sp. NCCP-133]|uniref:hypothetical protein n=1 Tax=Cytobacillus sp. NCCP-133 TaxID=766848 RepID=UPI00222F04B4|nr:hypothetical protein [Cytobacillus sp. NCCP-133]